MTISPRAERWLYRLTVAVLLAWIAAEAWWRWG